MRTLYFEINGQTLRKIDNFSGIIKGSKQYLKCHFAVKDPEWTGMGIVAVFENNDGSYAVAVQKDGSCMVPDGKCLKSIRSVVNIRIKLLAA